MKVRFIIGIIFLLLQVGSIVYARYIPERFFCWAPYDSHIKFEVFTTINGKMLTPNEAYHRYRYKTNGWEQRSINNIFSLISQYESTYGKEDNATVIVKYSTNGHKELEWRYKND
ncbi:hypothetical protein [uncultured Psychroserpens sp.]|uniref:hypothetical protein n=1 Tax=uncultured Psychroserpens sp. TaxID=255436 RepID=UPI00263644D0|nr:hypothetical protein [uncultured Psychroserpens sp.]